MMAIHVLTAIGSYKLNYILLDFVSEMQCITKSTIKLSNEMNFKKNLALVLVFNIIKVVFFG